jgi:hypothetical protein
MAKAFVQRFKASHNGYRGGLDYWVSKAGAEED